MSEATDEPGPGNTPGTPTPSERAPQHRIHSWSQGTEGHDAECGCGWRSAKHPSLAEAADEWRAHAGLPPVEPVTHPGWCDPQRCEVDKCGPHRGPTIPVPADLPHGDTRVIMQLWQPADLRDGDTQDTATFVEFRLRNAASNVTIADFDLSLRQAAQLRMLLDLLPTSPSPDSDLVASYKLGLHAGLDCGRHSLQFAARAADLHMLSMSRWAATGT
jgi:hypothetical protein